MPYEVVKKEDGFQVMKSGTNPPKFLSKKPLTQEKANKQMKGVYASESKTKESKKTVKKPVKKQAKTDKKPLNSLVKAVASVSSKNPTLDTLVRDYIKAELKIMK